MKLISPEIYLSIIQVTELLTSIQMYYFYYGYFIFLIFSLVLKIYIILASHNY